MHHRTVYYGSALDKQLAGINAQPSCDPLNAAGDFNPHAIDIFYQQLADARLLPEPATVVEHVGAAVHLVFRRQKDVAINCG
jgi:hypothetical protein